EMTQRFRSRGRDTDVASSFAFEVVVAARLNLRQLEFFPQHRREVLETDLHLEDVLPSVVSGLMPAGVALAVRADGGSVRPVTLADAAHLARIVGEMRNIDRGQRNAHQVLALAADQLALRHEFLQLLLNFSTDDLLES